MVAAVVVAAEAHHDVRDKASGRQWPQGRSVFCRSVYRRRVVAGVRSASRNCGVIPVYASDIDANAKPLARLVFDSAAIVALEVLVVPKSGEPLGGWKAAWPTFSRSCPARRWRRPAPIGDERSKLMIARRKMQHDIEGGLDSVDRKRRLQYRSVRRIRKEIILVPGIRVEVLFETYVIPEILRNPAAQDEAPSGSCCPDQPDSSCSRSILRRCLTLRNCCLRLSVPRRFARAPDSEFPRRPIQLAPEPDTSILLACFSPFL